MKTAYLLIASLFTASLTLGGCSVERTATEADGVEGYYFTGFAYDGVSGAKLTGYTLELTFDAPVELGGEGGAVGSTRKLKASVDGEGRYRVGPLKPQSDFTVTIEAAGYRSFTSHNAMRDYLPNSEQAQSTEIFEAYLFPTEIKSPPLTLDLYPEKDGVDRPTGSIRLVPTNGNASSDLSLEGTLGASVNNQIWFNDDDARNATVVKSFTDGKLSFAEGDLVYGVTYTGVFFGVSGYQYDSIVFTAGLTGSQAVVLSETSDSPLQLVSTSLDSGVPDPTGSVVFTFNRPIEFAPEFTPGYFAEIIDDNFDISSPDEDGDFDYNILISATDEPGDQERGTSIKIDGDKLTLSWANKAENFFTQDADDPILVAFYSGLGAVRLKAVGETSTSALSSLIGDNEVQVRLKPID